MFIRKGKTSNMKTFNKTVIAKAFLLGGILTLSACGSSDSDDNTTEVEEDTVEETQTELVDIKDVIFTNISSDCADYDNSYIADVTDVQEATDFELDVVISSDDSFCTMASNNIPNHDFNATGNFANLTVATSQEFFISRSPELSDSTEALSQRQYNAVMLNGVPLDILSAGCYKDGENVDFGCTVDDDWLSDPLGTSSSFGVDSHNAHTQPTGVYHYHGTPNAMFDETDDSAASPVIGFAADGFPVYGTFFADPNSGTIRKATSSYALKSGSRGETSDSNPGGDYDGQYIDDYEYVSDSGDLDECNGMTINGQYGYYVTESYPWVIACFSGTPDDSFDKL
jgi:hypothetical protein